jgi:predicted acyl esterase
LLNWFDHWLKEETNVDIGPPVHVQEHDRQWRMESDWPPRDATWQNLELSMPAQLVPLGASQAGEVRLQPNPLGSEEDARSTLPMQSYAEFTTGVLANDTHISGLPRVHVTVVPEGPGGTLAAWLYKKTPQGLERIGWTALNLLYADGTEQSTPVTPGEPIVAKMQIQPMDAIVPAGSELVLRIWGYPPGDRVANAAGGTINLVVGQEQSVLEIPTIERTAEAYFEVPFPAGEGN